MATWDNWDLGLAEWYKIVGCPGLMLSHEKLGQLGPGTGKVVVGSGMSQVVPWQLGTTGTWDWQGGVR